MIYPHQTFSIPDGPTFELTNIQVGSISVMKKFQPASQLKVHDGGHEINFQSEDFTPDEEGPIPAMVEEWTSKTGQREYQRVLFAPPEDISELTAVFKTLNVIDAQHPPKRELPVVDTTPAPEPHLGKAILEGTKAGLKEVFHTVTFSLFR